MSVGCATPSVKINGWEPGAISAGKADRLVITDADGRRSARESVAIFIKKAAVSWGYFQVDDRSADGVKLEIDGRQPLLPMMKKASPKVICTFEPTYSSGAQTAT